MAKLTFFSPLKLGFLVVTAAYFLFTVHAMFTLSWIGEWDSFSGTFRFIVLAEDVSATVGVAARLVASAAAFGGVILYLARKGLSRITISKLLRVVLIGEAVYWLGLLASGVLPLFSALSSMIWRVNGHTSVLPVLTSLLVNEIPLLIESIAVPVVLLKLSYELKPNRPTNGAIKWALIASTVFVFVFWLNNASLWTLTVMRQGTGYLTGYPANMLSFIISSFGLLVLALATAFFAKRYAGLLSVRNLNFRVIGAITLALGLIYLWNYLTWIFFGRAEIWSNWYAWFLGHNLNLWLLTLPLVGLPLLFGNESSILRSND